MKVQRHRTGTAPRRIRTWSLVALLIAAPTASCGGDSESEPDADLPTADEADEAVADAASADDVDVADALDDPEQLADDLAAGLEEQQSQQGGGSATLVVGDQTWTFDSVLCAFGEEQIGQAGAEFNLSSIQEGMQMYASVDQFGDSISLNDIEDFENPSVALSSIGDDFINLDGKSVTAAADFVDQTADTATPVPGTFEATCP